MDDQDKIVFPCRDVPADAGVQKLLGLYRQVQDDLWLQRVKIPGGRLASRGWHALAEVARQFTPGTPLHLTTRQDIEVHNLTKEKIPAVQKALKRAGLTCFGAAGDTYRNITVCPCAGTAAGTIDLMPLAGQIESTLQQMDGIYSLPRKFKIALSCSESCGQPWINDLGLVATSRRGAWGFSVIVTGSLGARPGTGMQLYDWIPFEDVLPLTVAAIRVFAEHGDRENRHKARLRHVRQRMGDEAFSRLLAEAFELAKAERVWSAAALPTERGRFEERMTLTFANGDITSAMADAFGQIEGDADFSVRIGNQHQVVVFGGNIDALRRKLAEFDPLRVPAKPQPSVVACPGKRWCKNALVHTNELADRIRAELAEKLPPKVTICVSGCPNGCAHSAIADIGLIGAIATREGRKQEVYNILTGGGMGHNNKLANLVDSRLSADEVLTEISCILNAD